MLKQTKKITDMLRGQCRKVRPNNLKINEWVDEYIDRCVLHGKPVEILTQYCLSKDLEKRYKIQSGHFVALNAERNMFTEAIPQVIEHFKSNGASVNWYVTFNNSFLDRGRVPESIIAAYMDMIKELVISKEIVLLNWEDDVLGDRPKPNNEVLENFESLVSKKAFELDLENLFARARQHSDISKTENEFRVEAKIKIACEAEEGRFIFSPDGMFSGGDILITPLEFPERLVFFETLAPDFQKRIVPILKLYPWRLDSDKMSYDPGQKETKETIVRVLVEKRPESGYHRAD